MGFRVFFRKSFSILFVLCPLAFPAVAQQVVADCSKPFESRCQIFRSDPDKYNPTQVGLNVLKQGLKHTLSYLNDISLSKLSTDWLNLAGIPHQEVPENKKADFEEELFLHWYSPEAKVHKGRFKALMQDILPAQVEDLGCQTQFTKDKIPGNPDDQKPQLENLLRTFENLKQTTSIYSDIESLCRKIARNNLKNDIPLPKECTISELVRFKNAIADEKADAVDETGPSAVIKPVLVSTWIGLLGEDKKALCKQTKKIFFEAVDQSLFQLRSNISRSKPMIRFLESSIAGGQTMAKDILETQIRPAIQNIFKTSIAPRIWPGQNSPSNIKKRNTILRLIDRVEILSEIHFEDQQFYRSKYFPAPILRSENQNEASKNSKGRFHFLPTRRSGFFSFETKKFDDSFISFLRLNAYSLPEKFSEESGHPPQIFIRPANYILAGQSPEMLTNTLAHEMGHVLTKQRLKKYEVNAESAYAGLLDCLSGALQSDSSAIQDQESFSDWIAARITGSFLSKTNDQKKKDALLDGVAQKLCYYEEVDPLNFRAEHPFGSLRLNRIFGRNPDLLKGLGCSPQTTQTCKL